MVVKFFHRSKERGSKPIRYFLGPDNDREFARVLVGNPVITEQLIDAVPYQNKFTTGVLSFTERVDEISEADKLMMMRNFEKMMFPGLEPDQYNVLWIEHSDKDRYDVDADGKKIEGTDRKGRLELNFLIPCMELRTGKALRPFWFGTDIYRVNAWKNNTNRDVKTVSGYALSDPNEPQRKRKVNPFLSSPTPTPFDPTPKKIRDKADLDTENRDKLRASIYRHMLAVLSDRNRLLNDRKAVVHELTNGLGLTIEREANKSITISHKACKDKNDKLQRVRLEGALFHKDFDPKNFKVDVQSDYELNHVRRKMRDNRTFDSEMLSKAELNKKLYESAVAPLALDIVIMPVSIAETAQKDTETLPVSNSTPKKPIQRFRMY